MSTQPSTANNEFSRSAEADARSPKSLLVISQVFPPDPTSVGQHLADAAAAMVERGWSVTVLTADRGYDDPGVRYARKEVLRGMNIIRLPFSSLGKGRMVVRVGGQLIFVALSALRALQLPRFNQVLISTSPPFSALAALCLKFLRRTPISFWAMDLNPDQAVAVGAFSERALAVRLFNWLNRKLLQSADKVITLDRFMAERLERKLPLRGKLSILPPWPHEDVLENVGHSVNPFRAQHNLEGKFVFMYSGNMSPASPLSPIVKAAISLKDNPRLYFMFIGGGLASKEVAQAIKEHGLNNMVLLPYQPLASIRYSLSAADVHLVTLGQKLAGIIHPCKVYGAMAIGRPFFYIGPDPSHITDILELGAIGWKASPEEDLVPTLLKIAATSPAELENMRTLAKEIVRARYSKEQLCRQFCNVLSAGTSRE